ncbi:MAG: two-component system response regulator [Candidatus Schekmanbacteria bacterium RBG_16_38_10]|uniref:Two-component system response regulator n=1 Tax=Candidatus Schekmanbacteria bacterium RBG_16_38_10 TaxID=1817879 RepID=A0A1F7RW72_9BACT|nr:MAG: two-component system response regulator [Candidatus Schekmanbacteria bacterium RBG_16_38_10]
MNNLTSPILLVDDEPQILLSYSLMLRTAGIKDILTIEDSRQVMALLEKQEVAVIVLDLVMSYISGNELLNKIKHEFPHVPVIIMTAINELEKAVECMKAGALDYLVKPVEENRLISSIQRVLELRALRDEVSSLKKHLLTDELENEAAFSSIITKSKKMRAVFHYVEAIAKTDKPVLIVGETGVGKELLARAIHHLSGLKGVFLAVNVAGLDDTMFSDTLFGHKKGAYTGADKERNGLIVQASDGTLLLDEIGDLNESSQLKLLRLLEEKMYYPLGADIPEKSNARIIATTNQDLKKRISEGKFRRDLYYRLCTHHIHIPPLHERHEDIPLLLDYFLGDAAKSLTKKKPTPPRELLTLLSNYHFPGNVRELQAMVFDAVSQHESGVLSLESFKGFIKEERSYAQTNLLPTTQDVTYGISLAGHFPTLKEVEDYFISEALKRTNGNQGIAASLLGLTRQALNNRIKRNAKRS